MDDCDLYAEGFNPVMSREERLGYHDVPANRAPLQGYIDRLHRAEAIVFCFPTWCFGLPAMLKGWFDRLLMPGVAFDLSDPANVKPMLPSMPPGPDWRRILETGMQFTEMRRSQAKAIASDLVAQGHLARDQMTSAVDELVDMSRRRSENLRKVVQKEVQRQLGALQDGKVSDAQGGQHGRPHASSSKSSP